MKTHYLFQQFPQPNSEDPLRHQTPNNDRPCQAQAYDKEPNFSKRGNHRNDSSHPTNSSDEGQSQISRSVLSAEPTLVLSEVGNVFVQPGLPSRLAIDSRQLGK
ncbi:hypothetical protein ASPWEDRAFT_436851 [Aspergillus wentii DTO 134E9]|uniref:Uncharacterized protein n=1 Tax=Aspergillus wentii DTO 134E9 TaxID=1073089 RepID=A0A1L9RQ23_ASPWE|nr:uncharacterized protein ASPWEDRAFT_436851 [Aspergillus wentii DTO 134E9]OJJ36963.1 hypothetical protein ASPWEDRAFT_436851 [Aspergillus wentii DTO 134E9]